MCWCTCDRTNHHKDLDRVYSTQKHFETCNSPSWLHASKPFLRRLQSKSILAVSIGFQAHLNIIDLAPVLVETLRVIFHMPFLFRVGSCKLPGLPTIKEPLLNVNLHSSFISWKSFQASHLKRSALHRRCIYQSSGWLLRWNLQHPPRVLF